jgi:hypothetical protein
MCVCGGGGDENLTFFHRLMIEYSMFYGETKRTMRE